MVSDDDRPPYFRPHLTKQLLTGEIAIDAIELEPPDWYRSLDIDLQLACAVTAIDPGARTLLTSHGPFDFEQLVLATGSRASRLPIPGGDDDRVVTIRRAVDAIRVLEGIESGSPVLVIGSGFVGCEVAASLSTRGIGVTMASSEAQPQAERLGPDAGALIDGWLRELGVSMRSGVHVTSLQHGPSAVRATLDDGTAIDSGWVIMATGATPNIEVAKPLGLVVDGAIPVDASMHTAVHGIFAVGDIVRAVNASAGRAFRVEHWGDAERMGQVAGTVAAGSTDAWREAPGFWSSLAGRQLKYVAWGDGWDRAVTRRSNDGLTIWYSYDGRYAGVLTYNHDEDLEAGTELVESNAAFDVD